MTELSDYKRIVSEPHIATLEKTIRIQRGEIERLRSSLERMTGAFRPFTLKPVGGAGSQARVEQDEQIAAHAEASQLLLQDRG